MSFLNRFYFFFFGVLLGVFILFLSLSKREDKIKFNYFPNSRVKNYLTQNEILFTEKSSCKIDCYNLDTALIVEYILTSDVDFRKSQIRGTECKKYWLNNKTHKLNLLFGDCNHSISLIDIFSESVKCSCQ